MAASQFRTSFVELRTSAGSVYAKPSFWEQLYLLWMFRNFHCLPREVLGFHQRRLIDKLCRAAVRQRSIAQADIIGIVENVPLVPTPKPEVAMATSNLIEMVSSTVEIGIPRAAAGGGTPLRWDAPTNRSEVARLIAPSAKVEEIAPPGKHSWLEDQPEKIKSSISTGTRAGAPMRRLAWILAGALVVAGGGILFRYQTQARPLPPAAVPPTAVETTPRVAANAPATAAAPPDAVLPSAATDPIRPAATQEKALLHASVASLLPESKFEASSALRPPLTSPEAANEDSTPEPRLQLAQPPQSGFRYPEAPNSALTGRVSLRAVIGMDGTVTRVDVLSGNRTLAVAAVQAVRHWRYPAPEMNGHAVEAETNIAISFLGDDAVSISFPEAR